VMRSDRAKYASNALWQGSAEENKETAGGTITYFGTYSTSEADSSIAVYVEGSSFPNWNGTDQKRFVAIAGDQLTLTVRPPGGGRGRCDLEAVEVIEPVKLASGTFGTCRRTVTMSVCGGSAEVVGTRSNRRD
jgi:hypothetical protein